MQERDLIDQIERLIQTGELPRNVQASSALLLGRLQSVINVRIMGPDRQNKEALLRALAQCDLPSLPTAEFWLQHGDTPEIELQFHDGSSQVFDQDTVIERQPVRVDIRAPISALELVSFHLVGDLDGSEGASVSGSHAFQDADIVVWCTRTFDAGEAAQWASAPDRLKDHSFLVSVTPEAALGSEELQALQDCADECFYALHHFVPESVTVAGGLLSDVFQIAKAGRRADQDGAALLLKTYETILADAAPLQQTEMPIRRPRPPESRLGGIYANALSLIATCAQEISTPMPGEETEDLSRVLGQCADTSQSIADLFETARHEDASFQRLREDVLIASDQLTLMTMEQGLTPAIDAVTTILQLKREFEMRCAA